MKAYIQIDSSGDYYNVNAFVAAVGFKSLGFEVVKYEDAQFVEENERDAIFVGGVGMVRKRLKKLNLNVEDEIEYPTELREFLNRKVWTSSLNELIRNEETDLFIKPLKTKLFQGKVINEFKDYIGLKYEEDVPVWCSEIIDIKTEWRCFVRYKELIDVRYYKGEWDNRLDLRIVKNAIAAFTNQPAAYCLDFGVDEHGKHYLIEVNDGHSLGTYGMGAITYAKFLSARWSELTGTTDNVEFLKMINEMTSQLTVFAPNLKTFLAIFDKGINVTVTELRDTCHSSAGFVDEQLLSEVKTVQNLLGFNYKFVCLIAFQARIGPSIVKLIYAAQSKKEEYQINGPVKFIRELNNKLIAINAQYPNKYSFEASLVYKKKDK